MKYFRRELDVWVKCVMAIFDHKDEPHSEELVKRLRKSRCRSVRIYSS